LISADKGFGAFLLFGISLVRAVRYVKPEEALVASGWLAALDPRTDINDSIQ
jgi:hypothetical protein